MDLFSPFERKSKDSGLWWVVGTWTFIAAVAAALNADRIGAWLGI